jgi:histidinol-phosphatase (PHP family)
VHSTFSIDGRSTISDICQSALRSGLEEIGFAEHMDFETEEPGYGFLNYQRYCSAIDEARKEFRGRLTVRKGVEVDYQSKHLETITQWLKGKEFDFTIGSVHFVNGKPIDLGNIDEETLRSLYPSYCREVILSIRSGLFEVVGHFDLISSFCQIPRDAKGRYVPNVLGALVDSKVHLEVNSRGFREGRNDTVPGRGILRDFFKVGGRRVSVGSDAHSAELVGSGIKESLALIGKLEPKNVEFLFQM